MKHTKIFLMALSIIATLIACNAKPGERTRFVNETYPLEIYVKSFLDNHKDFNTNDITRENANSEFEKQILDTLKNDNLLKGLPVRLERIGKTKISSIPTLPRAELHQKETSNLKVNFRLRSLLW